MRALLAGTVALLVLTSTATAAPRCTVPAEVTQLGTRRTQNLQIVASVDGAAQIFRPQAEDRKSRYLRLQLELADPAARGWRFSVRDADLRLAEALGPESFAERNVWTRRIPMPPGAVDPKVLLELVIDTGGSDPKLRMIGYLAMRRDTEGPLYSRSDGSREFDLFVPENGEAFDDVWRQRGDAVALLVANWKKRTWCCSGVFVADDLMLTNWHCGGVPSELGGITPSLYWNSRICESVLVDVSWDDDGFSREYVPDSCDSGPNSRALSVVASNRDLDYALLRLRQRLASGPQRTAPVRLDADVGVEKLVVLHHAGCLPKRMSDTCKVEDLNHPSWVDQTAGVDFTHSCNTELGSSGAPIFDDQGRVVGLHHMGFDWQPNCRDSDERNKAVKIRRIVGDLPRALCLEIVGSGQSAACAAAAAGGAAGGS